jgi:mycoredoxin
MSAGSDVSADVVTDQTLIMYSTPWCGYCRRLKAQLDRAGIPFTEIDITDDPEATSFVEQVNGGNQTVPTVRLPDGTALTNPTLPQLLAALNSATAS